MLADIWKSIGGDHEGQGQIPLSNCKNLLRAIQNFHHQDIMDLAIDMFSEHICSVQKF